MAGVLIDGQHGKAHQQYPTASITIVQGHSKNMSLSFLHQFGLIFLPTEVPLNIPTMADENQLQSEIWPFPFASTAKSIISASTPHYKCCSKSTVICTICLTERQIKLTV